jgi:hypothetical protein
MQYFFPFKGKFKVTLLSPFQANQIFFDAKRHLKQKKKHP